MKFDIPMQKYHEANRLKQRDCFALLKEYIYGNSTKVCSIYGLLGTGKATMMFQAMADVGLEHVGYILCEQGDTYAKLCHKLDEYISENKKVIFIAEITKIEDFVTASAVLADYYSGKGSKIVLTGSDSLGLDLAARGELYNRTENIHTTYVSYGEFVRLIEKTDIDDFIHYAGVLSHEKNLEDRVFFDEKTASHYIDTAISDNITNTFFHRRLPKNFIHKYDKLIGMHNRNTLVPTITTVVEMYSGVFLDRSKVGKDIESQMVFELNLHKDENDQMELSAVDQIKEHLSDLELFVKVPLIRHNTENTEYTYETKEYIYQPGMKYCQIKAATDNIRKNDESGLSPSEKEALCEKVEEELKRKILEVAIFADAQKFLDDNKYDIFKMQFAGDKDREIDMVIYDKTDKSCYCFTINYSQQRVEEQQKNLTYKPFQNILTQNFGSVKSRCVLYRGKTLPQPINGIYYIYAGDFLTNLYLIQEKDINNVIHACISKREYPIDNN